jgi:hypothetical protein
MTPSEYERKQDEIDRLLNDPETPMRADRIWALLDDLARANPMMAMNDRAARSVALY